MRPPSRSWPQPLPAASTKSSHFFSRVKAVHSVAPVLPSCIYCGNLAQLQAHAIQVQTLQNELESLKAQLANLKGKSSQLASHAQLVQGSRSREGPPRLFCGLSHNAMVGEYVFSNARNFSFTPEFATSFCPSYFAT